MPIEAALNGQIETCTWGDPHAPDTLIALHAAASAPQAFGRLATHLVHPRLRIVAPALQGYGATRVRVTGDPVAQHRAVASWTLEHYRGSGRTLLFGHSMGGLVALSLVAAATVDPSPARVALFEPIVLSCLDLTRADHRAGLAWDRDAVDGLNAAVAAGVPESGLAGFIRAWNETEWSTLPETLRAQLLKQVSRLAAETHTVSYYEFPLADLANVTTPVSVLFGGASPPVSAQIAAGLANRLSAGHAIELPNVGHMGPVLAPGDVGAHLTGWFGLGAAR